MTMGDEVVVADGLFDMRKVDVSFEREPFALVPPLVTFDGHRFDAWLAGPWLYVFWQARRGDLGAIELLTAFRVACTDADGKSYWPMEATVSPCLECGRDRTPDENRRSALCAACREKKPWELQSAALRAEKEDPLA
jgi:hypothetical protein